MALEYIPLQITAAGEETAGSGAEGTEFRVCHLRREAINCWSSMKEVGFDAAACRATEVKPYERPPSIGKNYNLFKCDRIQTPPPGPYNSDILEWFPSHQAFEAYIPLERLQDFFTGEETREGLRCRFRMTKNEIEGGPNQLGKTTKRYRCCYGPTDLRFVPLPPVPTSRTLPDGGRPLARSTKLRSSMQRGCSCHFAVVFPDDKPNAVMIRMFQRRHVDSSGKPCHGLHDERAIYAHAHLAPTISEDLRSFIERMLRAGVKEDVILFEHQRVLRNRYIDSFSEEPEDWTRDDQLSAGDIINIKNSINLHLYLYSKDDATCIKMWVDRNPNHVIFYRQQVKDVKPKVPFMLVWSTPWMLHKLATLGHGNAIAMDATFGTNTYEFSLFTVLAFDKHNNGVPCAWGLLQRHKAKDLVAMLTAIKKKVEDYRQQKLSLAKEWKPTCIIIDVSAEEQLALREVLPGVPINFCLWHVRRAWETNLTKKVKNKFVKAALNDQLGDLMYNQNIEDPIKASEDFMERWKDHDNAKSFIVYYKRHWHNKLSRWVKSFRHYPHANQNTNGSLEKFHSTMKGMLSAEKKVKNGRKVGWLVHVLTYKVEQFFWSKGAQKWQGCIRNKIIESIVLASINRAKEIPDSDVLLEVEEGLRVGYVRSKKDPEMLHECRAYDTDQANCTCIQAVQGNPCKHQMKCLLLLGWHESWLLHIMGTKAGSMCGGLDYAKKLDDGVDAELEPHVAQGDIDISVNDVNLLLLEEVESQAPEPKIPSVQDLQTIVDRTIPKLINSPMLMMQAVDTLGQWEHNMLNLLARISMSGESNVQGQPSVPFIPPTMQRFERIEGVDGSLKCKLGLTDWIHKGHRNKTQRQSMVEVQRANGPNPSPFEVKKKVKESISKRLHREAVESLTRHESDDEYDDTTGTPAQRRRARKKANDALLDEPRQPPKRRSRKQPGNPSAVSVGKENEPPGPAVYHNFI